MKKEKKEGKKENKRLNIITNSNFLK